MKNKTSKGLTLFLIYKEEFCLSNLTQFICISTVSSLSKLITPKEDFLIHFNSDANTTSYLFNYLTNKFEETKGSIIVAIVNFFPPFSPNGYQPETFSHILNMLPAPPRCRRAFDKFLKPSLFLPWQKGDSNKSIDISGIVVSPTCFFLPSRNILQQESNRWWNNCRHLVSLNIDKSLNYFDGRCNDNIVVCKLW